MPLRAFVDLETNDKVNLENGDYVTFQDGTKKIMDDHYSGSGKLRYDNGWKIDYSKNGKSYTLNINEFNIEKIALQNAPGLKTELEKINQQAQERALAREQAQQAFNDRNQGFGANMRDNYGGRRQKTRQRSRRTRTKRKSFK